ncbi:MAG: ComF family protein [Bacteroidetes bacterium]|nr:ComF family protein [Bacteroidota bacterium]
MNQTFNHLLRSTLQVIYPELCCICQANLVRGEYHVCTACAFDLPYITGNQQDVTKLSKLFWGRVTIEQVHSLFNYQKGNHVQTILHAIKYKSRPRIATHFGTVLAKSIPADHGLTCIVPVPLHPKKERKRGFNQSQAIAEGLSAVLELPLYNRYVIRNAFNESQTKFSKYDRYENVRSIFTVVKPKLLEKQHVLLVDDVLTTGATIESCAAELLTAVPGCKVSIATLAARV